MEAAGDKAGKAAEGGMRQAKRAAKEYADAALDAKIKVEELAKAQERLQTIPSFAGKSVRPGININGLDTRTGSEPLSPLAQKLLPQNQFDISKAYIEQKKFAAEIERVTQLTDKQWTSTRTGADRAARAIGLVGQGVSSIAGVPKSEAINQIIGAADQFRLVNSELTSMGGNLAKIAPAAGAGVAGLVLFANVFKGIREDAEKTFQVVQGFAAIGDIGVRGGVEQTKADLRELQAAAADIEKLIKLGRDNEALDLAKKTLNSKGAGLVDFDLRLDTAIGRARRLGVDTTPPEILEKQKKAEEERLKAIDESNKLSKVRLEQTIREHQAQERSIELTRESEREVANLRSQLTDNPLAKIYEAAEERQRQFLEKFKEVPRGIKAEMQKLGDELKSLDIFKLQFDTFNRIASTQSQIEDLKKNGGSSRLSELNSINQRRDEIEAEIFRRRKEGTLDPATHRQLLNEFDNLGSKRLPLFTPDAGIQRGVEFGQKQLEIAKREGSAAKQQIANDFIINSTNEVGKLSETQIQARNEALERKHEQDEKNLLKQQQTADTNKQAADTFSRAASFLEELFKKGFGIDVQVKESTFGFGARDMGISPGAETLFPDRFSNNY